MEEQKFDYYDVVCPYCEEINNFQIVQHLVEGNEVNGEYEYYKAEKLFMLICGKCHKFLSVIPNEEVIQE